MKKENVFGFVVLMLTYLQSIALTTLLFHLLSVFFDLPYGADMLCSMEIAPVRENLALFQAFVAVTSVGILSRFSAVQKLYINCCYILKHTDDQRSKLDKAYHMGCEKANISPERFTVLIAADNELNACAIGNQFIVVTTELINNLSEKKLAGVLAHEFAHVIHGDTKLGLSCYLMNSVAHLFTRALFCISVILDFFSFIPLIGWMGKVASFFINVFICILEHVLKVPLQLMELFGSRQNEYAADRYACEIGVGNELIDALNIIDSEHKKSSFKERLFSTHPDTDKRVERMRKFLEENE